MSGTRLRSPVVRLTLVACACSATVGPIQCEVMRAGTGSVGAQPESEGVSVVCFVPLTAGEIDQHNVTYFGHANPGEA